MTAFPMTAQPPSPNRYDNQMRALMLVWLLALTLALMQFLRVMRGF